MGKCESSVGGSKSPTGKIKCRKEFLTCLLRWGVCYQASPVFHLAPAGVGGRGGRKWDGVWGGAELWERGKESDLPVGAKGEKRRTPCGQVTEKELRERNV